MHKICCTLPLLLLLGAPLSAQDRLAIKGGRVLPVKGPAIEGGTVLISNGKIEAVGKDIPIPADARVIDATGKVVVPGFVDAHTSRGMDQSNETNPNVPFLSVVDAIDPSQDYFEECRRQGITTVAVVPGNSTMFGGQAAIVRTAGTFVSEMVIKPSVGIKISLKPTSDRNRMGHVAAIRKELDAARYALADKKAAEATPAPDAKSPAGPAGAPRPKGDQNGQAEDDDADTQQRRPPFGGGQRPTGGEPADAALVREALTRLLKGEMMAYIYCELAMDVPQALRLVKEYQLKAVLVLDTDCHKAVKQVAAAKLPAILDPTLVFWETDPRSGSDRQIALPKIYREAGVPVTFQVGGPAATGRSGSSLPPALGSHYLWYQAATAVKYGTPPDEALNAITLRPAQALNIADTRGSLEPGKIADVVILTGDPLKLDTWVETTIIDGKVVYERSKDRKLKALLKPEP